MIIDRTEWAQKLTYLPHQIEMGELIYQKTRELGLAILAAEERTGKTGAFLYAVEKSEAQTCLVVTKKAAIDGVIDQINAFDCQKQYEVINYQSIHKIQNLDPDVIILDEFHQALCAYPRPSETQKALRTLCANRPIIYVSATPFAESYSQSYHALQLSTWSPFKHKNFYAWHHEYGIEQEIYIGAQRVKRYNLTREHVVRSVLSPYIVRMTRAEVGFAHEPDDIIHVVPLDATTVARINILRKHRVLEAGDARYVADTSAALINGLYQLSGGGLLINNNYTPLSREKIDYILQHWGDTQDVAIMCHYVGEQERLREIFSNASIFSSTADAEGVDLSQYRHLIVYSMGFSTAKYVQRRCRQCNINRTEPINVRFLIADHGIDRYIYDTVAVKKKNFTGRVYDAIAS